MESARPGSMGCFLPPPCASAAPQPVQQQQCAIPAEAEQAAASARLPITFNSSAMAALGLDEDDLAMLFAKDDNAFDRELAGVLFDEEDEEDGDEEDEKEPPSLKTCHNITLSGDYGNAGSSGLVSSASFMAGLDVKPPPMSCGSGQASSAAHSLSSVSELEDADGHGRKRKEEQRDRGMRKGKKRKKASHHLTELKERTKRLESEKAELLQRLLHSRRTQDGGTPVAGVEWTSLSDLSSCAGQGAASGEGGEEPNSLVAAASGAGQGQTQLAAGALPANPSEVLRKRINHVQRMLNAFNSGGIDEFPNLIRELYHEDCTLLTPGVIEELRGQYAMAKFWSILVETFPDAIVEVISISAEDERGDKIDLHWRFRGTQIDQLPADRIIRTVIVKKNKEQAGNTDQISLSGHCFFTFRGEKISKLVVLWSTSALLLQQFGFTICELRRQQQFFFNVFRGILANGRAATEAVLRLFDNL